MYGSVTAAMAQERVADLYRQAEYVRLARVARAARRRGGRHHFLSAFGPRSA
ncbi:MAG TPA: hypothetical protein VGM21_11390 [Actinomycetota bacterium]|jgi:hypothetical protein